MSTSSLYHDAQELAPPAPAPNERATPMPPDPLEPRDATSTKHRCAFFFSIDGDLRFISHQDTMRVIQRLLARAEVPVRFSEGFNPHPRLSLVLPRPVGIASDAEALVIELEREIDVQATVARMSQKSPAGLSFEDGRHLAPGERLRPASVRYRLDLGELGVSILPSRADELMNCESLPVERFNHKNRITKTVDVRPFIENILIASDAVEYTLRVTDTGTARPAEIAALLGVEEKQINHCIRRMEVQWESKQ